MNQWITKLALMSLLLAIPAFAHAQGIEGLYPNGQHLPFVATPFGPNLTTGYAFAQGKNATFESLLGNNRGTFWRNTEWAKMLGLTIDQQKKMDDIFHQYRLKLIDLTAALEKEELTLEPLIGQGRPEPENETKVLTQIDRIAAARAELEKGNSKMMFTILQVLTPDQWIKLPSAKRQGGLPFKLK